MDLDVVCSTFARVVRLFIDLTIAVNSYKVTEFSSETFSSHAARSWPCLPSSSSVYRLQAGRSAEESEQLFPSKIYSKLIIVIGVVPCSKTSLESHGRAPRHAGSRGICCSPLQRIWPEDNSSEYRGFVLPEDLLRARRASRPSRLWRQIITPPHVGGADFGESGRRLIRRRTNPDRKKARPARRPHDEQIAPLRRSRNQKARAKPRRRTAPRQEADRRAPDITAQHI